MTRFGPIMLALVVLAGLGRTARSEDARESEAVAFLGGGWLGSPASRSDAGGQGGLRFLLEGGGGAAFSLADPSSGHLLWLRGGLGTRLWDVGLVWSMAYPGGRKQARVAALGGDLRLKLLRLAPRLAFHASLLVGTTLGDAVSDVAALPADTPRSSRAPSLLLAPGFGVRWAFGPAGVAAFLAEVRALGASHLALTFGAGLAF